jgi:hypothetical protein
MIAIAQQFDGDEWQVFIVKLLFIRFGSNLVEVPDNHKGDCGIEAFSLDGCAFQCYSPEGPSAIADLAVKHKKKIYDDITKFCKNKKELAKIFGNTKIKRWIIVVPEHVSADVVKYCQAKTEEVRNLAEPLPYIADDFQIVVVEGNNYLALEIAQFTSTGGFLAEATDTAVSPDDVASFEQENNELMETLRHKISKLHLGESSEKKLISDLLRKHLEGGNAMTYYDENFPVISDKVRSVKRARSTALEIDSALKILTISDTRENFEAELIESVPGLGKSTALTLSYACVTEWLMLCPLDPKEASNG